MICWASRACSICGRDHGADAEAEVRHLQDLILASADPARSTGEARDRLRALEAEAKKILASRP